MYTLRNPVAPLAFLYLARTGVDAQLGGVLGGVASAVGGLPSAVPSAAAGYEQHILLSPAVR